jgi:hypothetical protein
LKITKIVATEEKKLSLNICLATRKEETLIKELRKTVKASKILTFNPNTLYIKAGKKPHREEISTKNLYKVILHI